jgi:hypothetical protein
MSCSNPEFLAAMIEGRLHPAEGEAVLNHAADCDDCRHALLFLNAQRQAESRPLLRTPATARAPALARSARPSWVPWMVAAALALTICGLLVLTNRMERGERELSQARELPVSPARPEETMPELPSPLKRERPVERNREPAIEARKRETIAPLELPGPTTQPESAKKEDEASPSPVRPEPPPAIEQPVHTKPRRPVSSETVSTVAVVDRLEGDVHVITGTGKSLAKQGYELLPGDGLECSGPRSFALVSYSDKTRLELAGNTLIREMSERTTASAGRAAAPRRLYLEKGSVKAEVARQPEPMLFSTPHGEARVLGTTLRIVVDSDPKKGTHLEVEEGKVELRNTAGKALLVEAGHQAVAATGAPLLLKPLMREEVLLAFDFEDGKKPALVETGIVERGPGSRICLSGEPDPSGSSKVFIGDGANGLFNFQGDEVLSFDYWADPQCSQVNFNFWDRTQGKTHEGQVSKVVVGKWTRVTFKLAELGDAGNRLKERDWVVNLYLQGTGPPPRRFYIDNVLITRARVLKPRLSEIRK